jgi:hypothetical protein
MIPSQSILCAFHNLYSILLLLLVIMLRTKGAISIFVERIWFPVEQNCVVIS